MQTGVRFSQSLKFDGHQIYVRAIENNLISLTHLDVEIIHKKLPLKVIHIFSFSDVEKLFEYMQSRHDLNDTCFDYNTEDEYFNLLMHVHNKQLCK
jgi:hypothetical protein